MMKCEFIDHLRDLTDNPPFVSDEDYEIIEFVYTWHPCISDSHGKEQVAYLYNEFGIRIFEDMKRTAEHALSLMESIGRLKNEIAKLDGELTALRRGY